MNEKLIQAFDGKLQYEIRRGVDRTPIELNQPAKPIQADLDRNQFLRDKFNIPNGVLSCEGLLGRRIEQRTLEQHAIEHDRQARLESQARLKPCVTKWQDKPIRLWLEISR